MAAWRHTASSSTPSILAWVSMRGGARRAAWPSRCTCRLRLRPVTGGGRRACEEKYAWCVVRGTIRKNRRGGWCVVLSGNWGAATLRDADESSATTHHAPLTLRRSRLFVSQRDYRIETRRSTCGPDAEEQADRSAEDEREQDSEG